MSSESTPNRLAIFVDGQNLISSIRSLFYAEHKSSDYLPQSAKWKWMFRSVAAMLDASDLQIYWYTIEELDFHPYIRWDQENFSSLDDADFEAWKGRLSKSEEIREQISEAVSLEKRRSIIERYRKECFEYQEEMNSRLQGWKSQLNEVVEQCPFLTIRRPGWQLCHLVTKKLGREKGVDIGLAIELLMLEDRYDTALLFSSDGDYVPVIRALKKRGKQVGNVEFLFRSGRKLHGVARRLSESVDFTLEIPFEVMADFMNITPIGYDSDRQTSPQ